MTKLTTLRREAEKNLAEAKVLIQPEKSWIRDQQTILKLITALEACIEGFEGTVDNFDQSPLYANINKILEGTP